MRTITLEQVKADIKSGKSKKIYYSAKKEVAASLGTNYGHVYNVLKMYEKRPELVEKAINTPAE